MREPVARIGVGIAMLLGALGHGITFYPGAEAGCFGTAAVSALAGLLSRRWWLRLVAVALAAALGGLAWIGHLHGLRYQELMLQRG